MPVLLRFFLVILLMISAEFVVAQSEIVITHDGDPIDPREGIILSEVSFPSVRINLASEAVRERYPTSEITLVRNGRAVAQARFHGSKIGERNSLKQMLGQARAGDNMLLRLRGNQNGNPGKTITIPLR